MNILIAKKNITFSPKTTFSPCCENSTWVLPLTIYTEQTLDHKRTIFPPHLGIEFLLDSGATFKILNTDTWIRNLKNITNYN